MIPLLLSPIHGKSGIVATSQAAVVVGNAEEVINISLPIIRLVLDVGFKVESFNGEIDMGVEFSTSATTAIHGAVSVSTLSLLEAFQIDDENDRSLEDFERFGGLYVVLAIRAVPHVVLVEHFRVFKL